MVSCSILSEFGPCRCSAQGFDKVPLADWCERRVTCSYEEVTTGGYLPLWCGPGVPSRHLHESSPGEISSPFIRVETATRAGSTSRMVRCSFNF